MSSRHGRDHRHDGERSSSSKSRRREREREEATAAAAAAAEREKQDKDNALTELMLNDAVFVKQLPKCYPQNSFWPISHDVVNLDEMDYSSIHPANIMFLSMAMPTKIDMTKPARLGLAVLPKVHAPGGKRGNIPPCIPVARTEPIIGGLADKQRQECEERRRIKQELEAKEARRAGEEGANKDDGSARSRRRKHRHRRHRRGDRDRDSDDTFSSSSDDNRMPGHSRPPSATADSQQRQQSDTRESSHESHSRRRDGNGGATDKDELSVEAIMARKERYNLGGASTSAAGSGSGAAAEDSERRSVQTRFDSYMDDGRTSKSSPSPGTDAASPSTHGGSEVVSKPDIYDEASRRKAHMEYVQSVRDCKDAGIIAPVKLSNEQCGAATFEYLKIATADNRDAIIKAKTVVGYEDNINTAMSIAVAINGAIGRPIKLTPDDSTEATNLLVDNLKTLVGRHRGDLARLYDDRLRKIGSASKMLRPPVWSIVGDVLKEFTMLHLKNDLGIDLGGAVLARNSAMNVATKSTDDGYYDPPFYHQVSHVPTATAPPPPPQPSTQPQQQQHRQQQHRQQQQQQPTHEHPQPGTAQRTSTNVETPRPSQQTQPMTVASQTPSSNSPTAAAAPASTHQAHTPTEPTNTYTGQQQQQQQHYDHGQAPLPADFDPDRDMTQAQLTALAKAKSAMRRR